MMFAKCYFTVLTADNLQLYYGATSICSGTIPKNSCLFGVRQNTVHHLLNDCPSSHGIVLRCQVKRPLRLLDLRYFSYSDCVKETQNLPERWKLYQTNRTNAVLDLFNRYTIPSCKLNTYESLCEFFVLNSKNFSSLGIDGWIFVQNGVQVHVFRPESVLTVLVGELVSEDDVDYSWSHEDDSAIAVLLNQVRTFPDSERKCLSSPSTGNQLKLVQHTANVTTNNFVNSFLVT